MNYIFDKMKCKNKMKFIEETLGEYKYLALKEIIFSIRDLVEINSKEFLKKINYFFHAFIKHVSGDCEDCFIEGQTCKCGNDEKIYLRVHICLDVLNVCSHRSSYRSNLR